MRNIDALAIIRFHDGKMAQAGWPHDGQRESATDIWHWVEANHRCNSLLWNEEDEARRTDVGDDRIVAGKRRIDQYNQKRNDATEALDEAILAELGGIPRAADARLSSETAGAMIDRLSILCLKIHHMRKQTLRGEAGAAHVRTCEARLERLIEQRADLGACFDALLEGAKEGSAYFKIYRQFKMYNDPALNPCLYSVQSSAQRGAR